MKREGLIFCLLIVSTLSAIAQTRYREGYFIGRDNLKTKCLIFDVDWLNNPDKFKYRLHPDGDVLTAGLSTVKEFGVEGSKYVSAEIDVDTSRQATKDLNYNRNAEWKSMRVFLKVIVEGKASLYSYRTSFLEKFFYSVDGSPIEQLVYKKFLLNPASPVQIAENLMYLQQIKDNVLCDEISDENLKRIPYRKSDLQKHFRNFNACHGEVPGDKSVDPKINFMITPGVDFSALKVSDGFNYDKTYENSTALRLGIMIEYVLSFNNRKWSVIVEPTYQSHKSGDLVVYNSIELPLGARHGFFLTKESKLFLNGFAVFDLPLKYEVKWSRAVTHRATAPSISFAGGLGFSVRKISLEARRYFTRSTIGEKIDYLFVYDKFSFILGYQIK